MRGISSFCVLLGLILIVTILPCFSADPNTLKEESSKYLDAVREFADNVLKYVINVFCCFDIRYTQYEIHPRRFASIAAPMFSAKTEMGVSKTKQRRDSRTICLKTGILVALRPIFGIIAILNFGKFRVRRAAF